MDTKHTGRKGITEWRAARAARQIAYHEQRMRWMAERMEDAAVVEAYLTLRGEEAATLPGGRRIALDGGGVEVREAASEAEYEQLELSPDLAAGADYPD